MLLNTQKTILIIGGAGYIGSHTAYILASYGYQIIILDILIHNQQSNYSWATTIYGDFGDKDLLDSLFTQYNFEAIMHFAAFIEVGESVHKPDRFYQNNVVNTITLLDIMCKYNVKKIVFSSSCAVYGIPNYVPIDEKHVRNPYSPYGKTKCIIEWALEDYAKAYNIKFIGLRYFNAAGALYQYHLGECHQPETHLIPLLLASIKKEQIFTIFGDDYDTPDGSCIRDYIHVSDIAQAHYAALLYLEHAKNSLFINLGSGKGVSVFDLIKAVERITHKKIYYTAYPRRPGDVATLIADATLAANVLHWQPKNSTLDEIISSAWMYNNCF